MVTDERGKIDNSRDDISFIDPYELVEFVPESSAPITQPQSSKKKSKAPTTNVETIDETENEEPIDTAEDEAIEGEFAESELIPLSDSLFGSAQDYVMRRQEDTRGRLAMYYTMGTFFIFILGFAVAVLDGISRQVSIIDNLEKILPLISGIFLGSLGFVLGYYFRKDEEK